MEKEINMGLNQTGKQMSPVESAQMVKLHRPAERDIMAAVAKIGGFRSMPQLEGAELGTVPIPGALTGMANVTINKLAGENINTFIDKLAERAAFERGGVRLYDAFIGKMESWTDIPKAFLPKLKEFRNEEKEHFNIVVEAIKSIGGDPTVQTPCADAVGIMSLGLIQTITAPNTNFSQCLNAILTAELTDNAGWEILIALANKIGQDEIVRNFQKSLSQEKEHLATIQKWLKESIID